LINIYEHYVRDVGVDGLKLDFVDAFGEPAPGATPEGAPTRRDESVAEAAASLLAEVADRLRAINPDVMLEFRQAYIGPVMRRCGNIFRVGDVPNDFPSNRVNSIDLRLLSGNTAVHSDMLMWHGNDSVESAAMQMVHTLFAVPQVSILIDKISDEHRKMLTHYLSFWRAHRELLLDGQLTPYGPGMGFPQVLTERGDQWLAAVYAATVVRVPETLPAEAFLVNGTMDSKVYLEIPQGLNTTRTMRVVDCQGECIEERTVELVPGLMQISIPPAGIATLGEVN
jgi:alpha-galactosidase